MIARLVAVALLLSACSRQEPKLAPEPSPFQRFAEGIGNLPPCSRVIPMEWSPSLPVPVLVDRRLHYRVFFRGWEGTPTKGIKIRDAEGDALFRGDGRVLECVQRSKRGAFIPDFKLPTADRENFDARMRALYASIEEMGRLYARGTPILGGDLARAKAFETEFFALTPAGHAAAYRALNPDFWAWLEKDGR